MLSTHTHVGGTDPVATEALGTLNAGLDSARSLINADHDTFIEPPTWSNPDAQDLQLPPLVELGHKCADFGCSYINGNDRLRHGCLV
jgi:hypothetical protein